MNDLVFDFVPTVFWKVLAATLTVVLLGWVGAIWIYGERGVAQRLYVASIASSLGDPILVPSASESPRTSDLRRCYERL